MAKESTPSSIDVLIVGAGPTGLIMANELKRRGLKVRIVDQIAVPSDKSRALAVHARTLELFQKLGLSHELIATGRTALKASIYVKGAKKVDLECGDLNFSDTPYPFVLFTSQAETEAILEKNFRKLGGEVERSTELLSLQQNETGVCAVLRTAHGEQTVRSLYLVGCDGAHSKVRKLLGLTFAGAAYEQDFMLADVEVDWSLAPDRFRLFFGRHDLLAVFPMKGNLVRLIGTRSVTPDKDSPPTLAEIEVFAKELTKLPLTIRNPVWLARFRLHHRGVNQYAQGRCFVAGDAAHIHSPAGGQGMNTGIQDAYNLAWKLEWVIQKKAPESLLSTYHQERYPVGQFLLRFTDRLFQLGSSPNPLVLFVRNHLFWRFGKFILSSPKRRARALRTISQLGIRYRPNAFLIESDRSHRGPKVGERAPDVKIGKTSLFKLMVGTEAHLLCFGPTEPDALKDGHYKIHRLPQNGETAEAFKVFGVTGSAYYLIRPDGHVGYRSFGPSTEGLRRYISAHQSV